MAFPHAENTPALPNLKVTTGADGTVVIPLLQASPAKTRVFVGTGKDLYPCSTLLDIDMKQVVNEGMVSRCSKSVQGCRWKFSKEVSGIPTSPGQLVLFARPITWSERLLGHVWE